MKKLVILSQSQIDYIWKLAAKISDPKAKRGNFSRALRKIIDEYMEK